jgi:DNA repair protein RecO (recombination protein O)
MTLVTQEGILLRSHPYSETSRIMRFLTPAHGLVSVVARGARRESSRGRGGVETFDDAAIVLAYRESRDLHTLRDLQVVRSRRGLGKDLLRFAGASLLAELLLAHTLQEGSVELFDSVRESLDRLEGVERGRLPSEILSGAWGVLVQAGYPPELEACARCGGDLPGEGLLLFDPVAGGLLCPGCTQGREGGGRLGPGAREALRRLVRRRPDAEVRGARVHLGLVERFALHHPAPSRPLRTVALLRPLMEEAGERVRAPGDGPRDPGGDGRSAEPPSSLDPGQPGSY